MGIPKKLNKASAAIFSAILKQYSDAGTDLLKINVNGDDSAIMPLSVEKVSNTRSINTPWGMGSLYSFAHYYEQNGDLMRDPEIVFLVVDNRETDEGDMDLIGIFPQMFQQDNIASYRELIKIEDNSVKTFDTRWQPDVTIFANEWMKNLKWQQNIQPVKITGGRASSSISSLPGTFSSILKICREMG